MTHTEALNAILAGQSPTRVQGNLHEFKFHTTTVVAKLVDKGYDGEVITWDIVKFTMN